MNDDRDEAEVLVSNLVDVFREVMGATSGADRPHLAALAARRFVEHAVYEGARTEPTATISQLIQISEV